jgi:hypothetical protein
MLSLLSHVPHYPVLCFSFSTPQLFRNCDSHAALLFADFELSRESEVIHRRIRIRIVPQDVPPLGRPYKIYFDTYMITDINAEYDLFGRLFVKK